MGVFDDLSCSAPLSTDPPAFMREPRCDRFQTKDLPGNPYLRHAEIAEDGRLLIDGEEEVDFHGDIYFYSSNWAGCYRGETFTRNGEDFEHVGYVARFTDGRLSRITEVERERKPARRMSECDRDAQEDRALIKQHDAGRHGAAPAVRCPRCEQLANDRDRAAAQASGGEAATAAEYGGRGPREAA